MTLIIILISAVLVIGFLAWLTEGEPLVKALGLLFYPGLVVLAFYYHWGMLTGFWLTMTVVNVVGYMILSRMEGEKETSGKLLLSSFLFWPLQLWLLFDMECWYEASSGVINIEPELIKKIEAEYKNQTDLEKQFISKLPMSLKGTLSFDHHIGSVEPIEMVWLTEYPDVPLYMTSKLYDQIGIENDFSFHFQLIKKDGADVGIEGFIAWVESGNKL